MNRSIRRLIGALAAVALVGAMAGTAAAADTAWVRVVHASPDAPNVDVWVDGSKVLTDVPYTAVSDYLELPAGDHAIQVVETGTTSPAVIDATLTFEAGKAYTVAATGKLGDSTFAPVVLTDDLVTVDGMSKLRVFHASPAAPASVDVAVSGGPVLVSGLNYPEATGYLTVDPGTYDLEIRAAGDTAAALTLSATLEGGKNYTAIAMDGGDAGVQVIVAVDAEMIADTAMAPAGGSALVTIGLTMLAAALVLSVVRSRRLAVVRER
jgi:hypothetical protein